MPIEEWNLKPFVSQEWKLANGHRLFCTFQYWLWISEDSFLIENLNCNRKINLEKATINDETFEKSHSCENHFSSFNLLCIFFFSLLKKFESWLFSTTQLLSNIHILEFNEMPTLYLHLSLCAMEFVKSSLSRKVTHFNSIL